MKFNLKQLAFFISLCAGVAYVFILQYKNRELNRELHKIAQQLGNLGVFSPGDDCILELGARHKNIEPNQRSFILRRKAPTEQDWVMVHHQSSIKQKTTRAVPNKDAAFAINCLTNDHQIAFNIQSLEVSKYRKPEYTGLFYETDISDKRVIVRTTYSSDMDKAAIRFFFYPRDLKEPPMSIDWSWEESQIIETCDKYKTDAIYFKLLGKYDAREN